MSNATIAVSRWEIIESDCVEALRGMAADSVDACLTDVPYGLGSRDPTVGEIVGYLTAGGAMAHGDFMNKKWEIPPVAFWRELCRDPYDGSHHARDPGWWVRATGFDRVRDADRGGGGGRVGVRVGLSEIVGRRQGH